MEKENLQLVSDEIWAEVVYAYADFITAGREYALIDGSHLAYSDIPEEKAQYEQVRKEAFKELEKERDNLINIASQGKYVIKFKNDKKYYTLSEAHIRRLFSSFKYLDYSLEGSGSDLQMVFHLEEAVNLDDIEVYMLPKVKKNNGAYFKFTHNTVFDLKVLQILNDDDDIVTHQKYTSEHCFINAVMVSLVENYGNTGQFDFNRDIIRMKNSIGLGQFKTSDMSKILPEWLAVKVQHYADNTDKKKLYTYVKDKQNKKAITHEVKLFLFKEHFMPQIMIPGGIEALKDPKKYDENKKVLASTLVMKMAQQLRFNKSKFCVYRGVDQKGFVLTDEIIQQEQKILPNKVVKKKEQVIVFADFESIVYKTEIHLPFMLGFIEGQTFNCLRAYDKTDLERCSIFSQMLTILNEKYPNSNNFRIYFHNLKYDYSLIKMNPFVKIIKELERNGQIYQAVIYYKKKMFTLVDSWKMISTKLSKFQSDLGIDVGKMPFDLYNIVDLDNFGDDTLELEYFKDILKERENIDYDEKVFSPYVRNGYYYHMDHYKDYLRLDCRTLEKGIKKFRECIEYITGIDLYDELTISSIAFNNLIKRGCLDGCYAITGNLQKYIMDDVEGGRVCLRDNKKIVVEDEIEDFDAVGLYSSTMSTLGFQKGPYEIIKNLNIDDIREKYQEYTIEADVIIRKAQQIPMISSKDKFGVRVWDNKVGQTQRVKLNRQKLETLEKHQNIKIVEVINGVGNLKIHGYNYGVQQVITEYVNERAKVRAKNPGLGNAYKLLGNSTYGKTCLADTKYEIEYVKGRVDLYSRLNNNYHKITEIKTISSNNERYDRFRIKKTKPVVGNWNYAHLGSKILATSKCIMNDVLGLANDMEIPIYYTDTDSIHMLKKDVQRLGDAFKEKYNRELIGKNMLQFHTDFESQNIEGPVWSRKFIGLGKKCYLDILTNAKGEEDYHIRFKGASSENILEFCKEEGMTVEELYMKFYNGEHFKIDITKGKARFVFTNKGVQTKKQMIKNFKFN